MRKLAISVAVLGLAASLGAEYPGQYPPGSYPPSTYPAGQYPPGYPGGGIPIPRRGKKGAKKDEVSKPMLAADGHTISNDGKKLVIATDDGRMITMTLISDTKFTRSGNSIPPSQIVPRTTVHIEAVEDDEFYLTAMHVDLLKDAPAETPAAKPAQVSKASSDDDMLRPSILDNPPDAPGHPILRRKPANSETAKSVSKPAPKTGANSEDFTIDSDSEQTRIERTGDDLIDRTKEWAMTFTNGLPNFICQQETTRYMEESRSEGWQPQDVITAKVVYEDGREQYKEITVGGKRTNKSMLELGGSTSTGEFASTLHSLFSDESNAQFKFYQSTHVSDTAAAIYDFKVALHNSDWFITVGGQTLVPAYSGSVWIDKSTGQVRRLEMQANNIPKDFPVDSMEWAVDYDEVSLGTAKFLLPVHAENLGCQRGTTICSKNAIDFRDYEKFSGESTIVFK